MAKTSLIQCKPSGFSFVARRWKHKDRAALSDNSVLRKGLLVQAMLEAAALEVTDPGPYQMKAGEPPDWTEVALGDMMAALMQLRILIKDEIIFQDKCPHCTSGQVYVDEKLSALPHQEFPETGLEHIKTGNPLVSEVQHEDGMITVRHRILRGKDLPSLAKWQRQIAHRAQLAQVCLPIEEMSGGPLERPLTRIRDMITFLDEEDLGDFQRNLEEALRKHDGGVDCGWEEFCSECGRESFITVPFTGVFFYPEMTRSKASGIGSLVGA